MIDTNEVIRFFDRLAPNWDTGMVRNETVIERILDLAQVGRDLDVLDVACGTGVLISDYLRRDVASVTAVDISPNMAAIAWNKFAEDSRVTVLCGDAQTLSFFHAFDRIIIYNAFPHFSDPVRLFDNLCRQLKPGGRLTVAHGMSRERINDHHRGGASHVSRGLIPAEDLATLLAPFVTVDHVVSDETMYLVSGFRCD